MILDLKSMLTQEGLTRGQTDLGVAQPREWTA